MAKGSRLSTGAVLLAMVGMALTSGCGPIEYVGQVTRKASTAVSAAKAVDADKYSPYFYTLAVEYLHKAREEAASADFQAANRFGRRSEKAAKMAKVEALERAGKPLEQFLPNFKADDDDKDAGGEKLAPLIEEDEADEADGAADDGVGKDGDDGGDDAKGSDGDDEVPPGLDTL
jgi:hypothetical protein